MTILEMMEKRKTVFNSAKEFAESHKTDNGTLNDEDYKTYEKILNEVDDMSREISRMQKQENIENELLKTERNPIVAKPKSPQNSRFKTFRGADEYKLAALNAIRSNFSNVSDVLQEGVDTDGGYLVPEEYDHRLIDVLDEENIMRTLGTKIITSAERKINVAATKPAASWVEEGKPLSFGEATFDQVILDAHKLQVAIKVTEELLYDSAFNIENYIIRHFGMALANAEEDAFLNGDGTGKPTGIFAASGGGTIANTVAEVTTDSVIGLVYGLKRPYRKNASFIMNDKTLASLRSLKDNNGTYLWQPNYQSGEPDRFLGYKVYTSAYAPLDAVAFGDFSYYNIGDRGTRSFSKLTELFAGNGMVGFLAKERVDGKLVLPEAVQILKISGSKAAQISETSGSKAAQTSEISSSKAAKA